MSPTGRTRDGTWQLGVRRSAQVSPDAMWDALMADPAALLGVPVALVQGATGEADGVDVRVRSLTPAVVVRMSWWEDGWERDSSVQLRIVPGATGTSLSLAHEGLPDQETRTRLLAVWTDRVEAWVRTR